MTDLKKMVLNMNTFATAMLQYIHFIFYIYLFDSISYFYFRLCREISFQFRTRLPHGLLVYHNVKNPDGIELDPYALYVIVEKGQLKVVHVFGKHSTSVTVGEGLNRDEWHSVMVGKNEFASCKFSLTPRAHTQRCC